MFIDMWYGDRVVDVDFITCFFSDVDCVYRGNCFIKGKVVGDFNTKRSYEIERTFPFFEWE